MPDVMIRLRRLLRPGGVIYASFKYGSGERIKDGRFFCDMTDESCRKLFEGAGFTVIETFMNADTREGREDEKWVNAIGEKS
ncbi:MAG: type III restriction endonuclease subunit R [Lachnospiraceae bacterium]|nr:type III restriction endonuclease subunit R [Lachnospiraceae bacterium]